MQAQSDLISDYSEFLTRTDTLAEHLGIRVIDLPEKLGVSQDMLMGYRTGRYPVSRKAWRKLRSAETEAGIVQYVNSPRGLPSVVSKSLAESDGEIGAALAQLPQKIASLVRNEIAPYVDRIAELDRRTRQLDVRRRKQAKRSHR